MSIKIKLQKALTLAGGLDGHPRWWLAPDGELEPCSEHEYAAREILRGLKLMGMEGSSGSRQRIWNKRLLASINANIGVRIADEL